MHALGVIHTHSRLDRDNFLNINLTNVSKEMMHNYAIFNQSTNVVPYEYGSTMHYYANISTMFPKKSEYSATLGIGRVTFYDMVILNTAYNCKCPNELLCGNGGYTNPSKCSECICPLGYGGVLCDRPVSLFLIWPSMYIGFLKMFLIQITGSVQLSAESYWKGYWIAIGSKR